MYIYRHVRAIRPAYDHETVLYELLNQVDSHHRSPDGQVQNTFKFCLLKKIQGRYPPVVGDAGLAKIYLVNGLPTRDGRHIAPFTWIKNKFDVHVATDFNTFQPEVAAILKSLYQEE